ncbi:conjugative transfer protein MobI(A/C) [Rhodanobacter sp. BL-MT-08]
MDPAARSEKIGELRAIVTAVRAALENCADLMWQIQDDFQAERRAILAAVRRQLQRGQTSNLLLCVRCRPGRVLGAPTADWKRITARGHRVQRAKMTVAEKRRTPIPVGNGEASHINIFSNTIPKNKKHGWRRTDLARHAHPSELELVYSTEAKLQPLRKRVAALAARGTRALQALYQHERALQAAKDGVASTTDKVPRGSMPKAGLDSPARAVGNFERPQLLNPQQSNLPAWANEPISKIDSDTMSLDIYPRPQLRKPE